MPRYYFDIRDDDHLIKDEDGVEFDHFDDVKAQAAASLMELAQYAVPGPLERKLHVEVRDDWRRPLLKAALTFEAQIFIE